MSHTPQNDLRPFLSVITWPEGETRESLAQLISQAGVLDAPTLRMRLGQAPPSIIGQVEPHAARRAEQAIRQRGGDAFNVTFADLYALGPAKKVRAIAIANGVLAMQLHGGEHAALRFQNVWLLVQGMIREKVQQPTTYTPRAPRGFVTRLPSRTGVGLAASIGAAGLAAYFGAAYFDTGGDSSAGTSTVTHTRNKLHIHDAAGTIYEINGRRFDFTVLGEMKQYSERANMEQLCDLLSHLAPDEIVDPYFPMWKPPPRHHQLRIEGETDQADRPFAFYSRWAARLYRHVLEAADTAMVEEN